MKLEKQKGQTLIEVLAAMGAGIIILSAIVTVVIKSLNNSQYSKYQSMASQYAQEGMEIMHQLRDVNWSNLTSPTMQLSTKYCLDEDSTSLVYRSDCSTQKIQGVFVRDVQSVPQAELDCGSTGSGVGIIVTVSWKDAKCTTDPYCNKSRLDSCFFNLKTVPTP